MVDQKLEDMLSAQFRRITGGQQVETVSELPAFTDQRAMEVKAVSQVPARDSFVTSAKSEPQSKQQETVSGSSFGSKIGNAALDFGKSRLGAMPLISTLVGLFTGGADPEPPPPLVKYAMPPSIHMAAANSRDGGSLRALDYGQGGMARAYSETTPPGPASSQVVNAPTPQIVVNVQAMDSRSFLDHSQEIAQAVREAMLNMHSLNDVVSEL